MTVSAAFTLLVKKKKWSGRETIKNTEIESSYITNMNNLFFKTSIIVFIFKKRIIVA